MKAKRLRLPGFRAVLLVLTPLIAVGLVGTGCTSQETRYKPDGTPYTEEEFDPLQTVGALLLIGLVLGAAQAADEED